MPAAGVLFGCLVLLSFVPKGKQDNSSKRDPSMRPHEITALVAFLAIPILEYAAAKLTGAPFFDRYGISTVAGFAALLGIAVARRPAVGIGTLLLLAGQIGFRFLGSASGSVLVEPSSGYEISTRILEFRQRYVGMDTAENADLPIVMIDDLDFTPTSFYAPARVSSRLVYVVWGKRDIIGQGYIHLRTCCHSTPAVFGLPDFLASHDAFLVYGGPRAADRLMYFVNDGATVTLKRVTGDHFLALVTYAKGAVKGSPR
jgi:hypothetical protein